MTAAIPPEMKALPQWVVWRYRTRKGKKSKPPYQSLDPKQEAKPNDPSTWSRYSEAVEAASIPGHKLEGIGFMFGPGDGFAGVDLDNCLDATGKVLPWARPILDRLTGYAEVSPSGRGVKVFSRGSVPNGKGRKVEGLGTDGTGAVEVYDRGRYFTVTGRVFEGRSDIGDGADQLASLHAEWFPPEKKPTGKARVAPEPLAQTDADILDKIRRSKDGAKFEALFSGSTEGYASPSNADLALCNILAFWFGGDVDAIDRVFRQSGLCREKWTERPEYREMTIGKAMKGRTKFYDRNYRSESKRTTTKRTTTRGVSDSGQPNGDGATATATAFTDLGRRPTFGDQPGRNGRDSTPPGDGATGGHAGFHRTDLGNAERLVSRHGADLRYCELWSKWLVWDGCRWTIDNRGEAKRRAKRTARAILNEAADEPDEDIRKRLVMHALATEKRERLSAMLHLAESESGIPIVPEDMIGNPWLFNCLNGTIDLRTGKLRPHDRADHIMQLCPVEFDPNATCPLWLSTLEMFMRGNNDMIRYIQMIAGYALTGDVREQILPIAWGHGGNGKSTIFDALVYTFGTDYAMNATSKLLMAKKHEGHPTELAALFGKRLVIAMETARGKRLDEERVKQLTSIAPIQARRMHEDFWEFSPTHTLILGTNHRPNVGDDGHAIWRRLKLVEFAVKVEKSQDDKGMGEKLKAEKAGILAWCVRGCLDWQRSGLVEPAEVAEATAAYRAEQDVFGTFFDECTVQGKPYRVKASDLYARFKKWAETRNEFVMSQTAFGRAMEDRGIERRKSGDNWYHGLALKALEDPSEPSF